MVLPGIDGSAYDLNNARDLKVGPTPLNKRHAMHADAMTRGQEICQKINVNKSS